MRIKVDDLKIEFSRYSFELLQSDLKRLDSKYQFEKAICVAALKRDKEFIILKGEYQITLNAPCDYCFSSTQVVLDEEFELDLMPEKSRPEDSSDVEISIKSRDVEYYQGFEISLAGYFEDQIILDLPMSVICSETCKGVCQQCGINRNISSCDCEEQNLNNPFKVLKDLNLTD